MSAQCSSRSAEGALIEGYKVTDLRKKHRRSDASSPTPWTGPELVADDVENGGEGTSDSVQRTQPSQIRPARYFR